jgi:predicted nuclease of predicted toxin-antitoxin system
VRFLIDAQLPPRLAPWLRERGHEAEHVRDLSLDAVQDDVVVAYAVKSKAVIITKDADFSYHSSAMPGCRVVRLRLGNCSSEVLMLRFALAFGEIERALKDGHAMVKVN